MPTDTPLHKAANSGDLITIQEILEESDPEYNVNCAGAGGRRALHRASGSNNLKIVKYLISKGADINITDNSGRTCIQWAALGGHSDVLDYLLGGELKNDIPPSSISYGKEIDLLKTTSSGMNMLHGIVYNGNVKCLVSLFTCDRIIQEERAGLEIQNQKIDLGVIDRKQSRERGKTEGKDNRSSEVQRRDAVPSLSETINSLCARVDEDGKTPFMIAKESFKFDICDSLIIHGDPSAINDMRENESSSSCCSPINLFLNICESIQNFKWKVFCSCFYDNFQEGEVEMPNNNYSKAQGGTSI